jgi:hypothetical protein
VRVLQPSGRVAKTSLYQPFHRPHRKIRPTSVPGESVLFGGRRINAVTMLDYFDQHHVLPQSNEKWIEMHIE